MTKRPTSGGTERADARSCALTLERNAVAHFYSTIKTATRGTAHETDDGASKHRYYKDSPCGFFMDDLFL